MHARVVHALHATRQRNMSQGASHYLLAITAIACSCACMLRRRPSWQAAVALLMCLAIT